MEKRQARGKEDGVSPCWGRVKDNRIEIVKTSVIILTKMTIKWCSLFYFK